MDKQRIRFLVRSDCAEKKSQVPKKLIFFLFHFFNRCFVCMFCVRSIHTGTHGALGSRPLKLLLKVVECYRPSNGLSILISYIVWGSAWLTYRRWSPESPSFILSALIYASACVVAFFHLGRFFQVSSTLGPMQLCLFNMLKDVINFLAIISVLFFAFSTGLTKIYSYYIQSEKELQIQDKENIAIHYNTKHSYAK